MALTAFFTAPPIIQVHAGAAIGAMILGPVQFLRPKGTTQHKLIGWGFVVLMMIVAISSFFIHTICQLGGFSLIHILSIVTLINVPRAVIAAKRHNIRSHKRIMISLYAIALIGAGLFTLLPGRLMHDVVFGTQLAESACDIQE